MPRTPDEGRVLITHIHQAKVRSVILDPELDVFANVLVLRRESDVRVFRPAKTKASRFDLVHGEQT